MPERRAFGYKTAVYISTMWVEEHPQEISLFMKLGDLTLQIALHSLKHISLPALPEAQGIPPEQERCLNLTPTHYLLCSHGRFS